MKIGIFGTELDQKRVDGTRVYLKNVLSYFGKLSDEDEFFLYHKTKFNPSLKPVFSEKIFEKRQEGFLWAQNTFPRMLKRDEVDVCWMPIQQVPFFHSSNIKFVITIHDLAFKYFPASFPREDLFKHQLFLRHGLKKADGIIAVSYSTKKDILKFYPWVDSEKIKVIHHGFDRKLFEKKASLATSRKVFEKYRLIERGMSPKRLKYILYVGAIQPRKDLPTLVKAFEKIKQNPQNKELKLILVGSKAWLSSKVIDEIEKSTLAEEIIFTGGVNFEELPIFYQNAQVFVLPSLYEGFGLPILEAMASRVPVICAKNSSLEEIGKGVVEFFHSADSGHLANRIEEVLKNKTKRAHLIEAGVRRARDFSWRRCAGETLEFLKSF